MGYLCLIVHMCRRHTVVSACMCVYLYMSVNPVSRTTLKTIAVQAWHDNTLDSSELKHCSSYLFTPNAIVALSRLPRRQIRSQYSIAVV